MCMFIWELSVCVCVYVCMNMHADAIVQTSVSFLEWYLLIFEMPIALKLGS